MKSKNQSSFFGLIDLILAKEPAVSESPLFSVLFQRILSAPDVVLALSGGRDSMLLFHILRNLGLSSFRAFHLNHRLRESSDQDEEFTAAQCYRGGVALYNESAPVAKFAEKTRQTLEEAGRKLRHRHLFRITGPDSLILTAHHANDSAESSLFAMIRGSAASVLKGMSLEQRIRLKKEFRHFYRPLLVLSRKEINALTEKYKIPFIEDESNHTERFKRNRIRSIVNRLEQEGMDTARYWRVSHGIELSMTGESGKGKIPESSVRNADYFFMDLALFGSTVSECKQSLDLVCSRLGLYPASENLVRRAHDAVLFGRIFRYNSKELVVDQSADRLWFFLADAGVLKPAQIQREQGQFLVSYNDRQRKYSLPAGTVIRRLQPGDQIRYASGHQPVPLKEVFQRYKIPSVIRGNLPLAADSGKNVKRILLSFLKDYQDINSELLD